MQQYASIGKLVLKNAIGLQRNRKEIEYVNVSRLDERASGCFECPNYSLKQFYKNQPDSQEYINAKNISQYTDLGKDRIALANDMRDLAQENFEIKEMPAKENVEEIVRG